jgi:dipeptidase
MKFFILVFIGASIFFINKPILSCTNLLVTKGASADGSTMVTYTADSYDFYGELYHSPAAKYPDGVWLDILEWDSGKKLGKIKQANQTYNVVGNMNEYQVVIGETTFGGRSELVNPKGIMDYGSLMYIALQRAKSAREAIKIMTDLVEEYGYQSSGESFSVADPNEVWIMEMIGKGEGVNGANWVAVKIPDGYISGHANASRITTFPLNDPQNVIYSKDIISFAREKGYFDGKDSEFNFGAAYDPLNFGSVRFCDARVWSMFRRCNPAMEMYLSYIRGESMERMPLCIKPDKKLTLEDVMGLMRDNYEGTEFDMTTGLSAGPYKMPVRWRPLVWEYDGNEYFNERPISTPQTGWSYISQSRSWLPNEVGGLLWFGVDDTKMTVYIPMYASLNRVPDNFKQGVGSLAEFTWDSAFWVFNFVSNYVYPRYSLMVNDVFKVRYELEGKFLARQKEVEDKALALSKISKRDAIDYLTDYSNEMADVTIKRWKKLGEHLIQKYIDGVIKDELNKPINAGYPEDFKRTLVDNEGDKIKMKKLPSEIEAEVKDNFAKAEMNLKEKNYQQAKTHLTKALELRPNDEEAKTKLSVVEQIMKEIDKIHQEKLFESSSK